MHTQVYGALRLLESFSQLVVFDFDCGRYEVAGVPWQIADAPRFAHRGLMVDTARHYEPLAAVRAIIDSLAYAKLNVLHWHSMRHGGPSNPRLAGLLPTHALSLALPCLGQWLTSSRSRLSPRAARGCGRLLMRRRSGTRR